jgi:hypothetical protein
MTPDRGDASTGPVVPEQRGVRDAARGDVLHRHARLTKNGRPVFCRTSQAEVEGRVLPRQGPGSDGKVIYSTREAAEAAARELESLGAQALRSYRCGRSRGGHYHLTTDATRADQQPAQVPAQMPLHLRIPQQRGPLTA